MNSRLVAVGLVRWGNKYLLVQKPSNVGPYPNTWHIPGGGVKLDRETAEEAVKREIREETGLKIKNVQKIGFVEDETSNKKGEMTRYVFLDFTADYLSGEAKAGDDLSVVEWFEKEELNELNLNKVSREFLEKLGLI